MKKLVALMAVIAMTMGLWAETISQAKANKQTKEFRYEIECAGNGAPGTYMVRVWSYSKKTEVAENQCRKNAVHGVLFKGFGAGIDNQCVGQRPMIPQTGAETEFVDYFKSFFAEGGEFQKYASIVPGTNERMKVGKEYRVGCVVIVRKDELRKAMESAGIIKGLGFGF